MVIAGTEGYAEDADSLIERYESVLFAEKYESVLHLMPEMASDVLDIGAGTGADAAWFAAAGHRVFAVEPTDRLRDSAKAIHPSPLIEWVADSLPDLQKLISREQSFDLVLLAARTPPRHRRGKILVHGEGGEGRRLKLTVAQSTLARAKSLANVFSSPQSSDPLTRPAPADENAGCGPPSPPKGRGK